MVNKFNRDLGSTPKSAKENVKKYSKEIVELLVDKEIRYHKQVVDPLNVCDEAKVAKVKLFVGEYVQKLIAKRKTAREGRATTSPNGKRKRSGEEENTPTKRVKSPSPAPPTEPEDATVASVDPQSPPLTRKRSYGEDGGEDEGGRESPKRHRSFECITNGAV